MCGFVGGSMSLKIGFQVSKASVHSAPHHGDVLISKTLSDPLIRRLSLEELSWPWPLIAAINTISSLYLHFCHACLFFILVCK